MSLYDSWWVVHCLASSPRLGHVSECSYLNTFTLYTLFLATRWFHKYDSSPNLHYHLRHYLLALFGLGFPRVLSWTWPHIDWHWYKSALWRRSTYDHTLDFYLAGFYNFIASNPRCIELRWNSSSWLLNLLRSPSHLGHQIPPNLSLALYVTATASQRVLFKPGIPRFIVLKFNLSNLFRRSRGRQHSWVTVVAVPASRLEPYWPRLSVIFKPWSSSMFLPRPLTLRINNCAVPSTYPKLGLVLGFNNIYDSGPPLVLARHSGQIHFWNRLIFQRV